MTPLFAQAAPATYMDIGALAGLRNPYDDIAEPVMVIAFVILVAGTITTAWQNRNEGAGSIMTVMRVGILAAIIAAIPLLHRMLSEIFLFLPNQLLSSGGINGQGDQIRQLIIQAEQANNPSLSLLDMDMGSILMMFLCGVFDLLGQIGAIIMIPLNIVRFSLELALWAFMPIGIALQSLPAMKERGTTYVLATLSVMAWPLGFAVVNITAGFALQLAILSPAPGNYGAISSFLAPLVAGIIMIFGSLATPLVCFLLFTTGASSTGAGAMGNAATRLSHMMPRK